MQRLADLLGLEVLVASARESTAIGSAGLAAHSALGLSLEALAERWRAEAVYKPQMPADERQAHWQRWQRALAAAVSFHAAEAARPDGQGL
jgi:glycerol kinase